MEGDDGPAPIASTTMDRELERQVPRYRYPLANVYPDYLRVALGMGITLGPLMLLELARPVAIVLIVLVPLFGWFGIRTLVRHLSWLELSSEALVQGGPAARQLPWDALSRVKLAYYAPRRLRGRRLRDPIEGDRTDGTDERGWLELTLAGVAGKPIRLDSSLEGFDPILGHALAVARAKGISLDPTTQANLAAIGIETAPPG